MRSFIGKVHVEEDSPDDDSESDEYLSSRSEIVKTPTPEPIPEPVVVVVVRTPTPPPPPPPPPPPSIQKIVVAQKPSVLCFACSLCVSDALE